MRLHATILMAALSLAPAMAQSSLRTEDLIGRWGVAAYWNAGDAQKVTQQARGFCSQPYVITRGAAGGAVMFEPFDGTRREVLVQSGQIVAASGDSRSAKTVSSWNGQVLVFNYNDEEAKRKYGNMVFVRCGR